MTLPGRALLVCGALFASACDPVAIADNTPPRRPELERADVVRYHMRLHFDDLRSIQHYLVAGRLKEARALAFMISKPEKDRGLLPWAKETLDLVDTAGKLAKAASVDEALHLEVQVAVACAKCHDDTSKTVVFPMPGRAPLRDHASSTVRMVRHQWATDRRYDAVVLGCATRFGHPAAAMAKFVAKHRRALETRPTAYFSVDGTSDARANVDAWLEKASWKPTRVFTVPGIRGARLRRAIAWLQDRVEAKSITHVEAPTDRDRIRAFADDVATLIATQATSNTRRAESSA